MADKNLKPGADATGPRTTVSAGERDGILNSNFQPVRHPSTADELDRARGALAYLNPFDHDTWLKVGMALRSEFGDDAWPPFDDWSQQADNYNPRENLQRWRSFKTGGGIKIGTLYGMARNNGWRDDGRYRVPEPEEIAARARQRSQQECAHRIASEAEHAEAARKATMIWSHASQGLAGTPYCQRKGIIPTEALREIDAAKAGTILGYPPTAKGEALQGACLAARIESGGKLTSLQLIDGNGRKHFIKGSAIGGSYWAAQPLPSNDSADLTLLIAEGIATVMSAHQATGHLAFAAMMNSNLPAVVAHFHDHYPQANIIVLADLDKSTGEPDRYAQRAAQDAGSKLAIPAFEPGLVKDFNDTARLHGAEAVRTAISNATSRKHPTVRATSGTAGGNDRQPWPDLVPLQGGDDLPMLPPDLFGGWLGEYAVALAAFTETPFELPAAMVLGAVSTAAARRIRVRVKADYFEPTNLWLLPALAPGNRKSAVEKAAAAPLREWEREQIQAMSQEIAVATSEAKVASARAKELHAKAAKSKSDLEARTLARRAADIEQSAPVIPKPPQLWTSDATPENLGVLLADNGERMAWISAEGGFFEIVGGRYSKGVPNLDLMLKAHAGDSERVDRLGRPAVYLREPLLSVALSPQPDLLRGLVEKPGFRGRGLLGRFLYFLPPSPLGWRNLNGPPIPERVALAYRDNLRAMLQWPERHDDNGEARPNLVRLSEGAFAVHQEFARTFEKQMRPGEDFEHATDWAGKAPGAAARVAGVLHAAEYAKACPWEIEVSRQTMERACKFVAISARHALSAFNLMAADEGTAAATRVWEWIVRQRRPQFQARDVWQGLKGSGSFARMADVSSALEVLVERGYVRSAAEAADRPGRPPSPRFIVRPELALGWK